MAHIAQCKSCSTAALIDVDDVDVHDAVDAAGCACCPQAHHHGRAAEDSGEPCRPLSIILLAASPGELTPVVDGGRF